MESIEPHELLKSIDGNPLIDVRTPAEYASGHIPGAINIPLFTDQERKVVGTLYKQSGRLYAMLKALDIVGPNLSGLVKDASKLQYSNHIVAHCWRGGMRSAGFAWLLNTANIPTITLKNGYKGFRNHILSFFSQPWRINIITACTGSGKTELLHYLNQQGHQVVDLEGLAHHKGSAFGGLGKDAQPTTEQFQNDLFWAMKDFDPGKTVWMEDESLNIGRVSIPDPLWRCMRQSPLYRVDLCIEQRIARLVNEYSTFEKLLLAESIQKIAKRLGGQDFTQANEELEAGNFAQLARILLTYYDKAYNKSISERQHLVVYEKLYKEFNPAEITSEILDGLK